MNHARKAIPDAIWTIAVTLVAAAAWLLLSTAPASGSLGRVVALGDSSASGPNLGPEYSPPDCDRTTGGYPEIVASQVILGEFVNETCTGATTSSLYAGYTFPMSGNRVRAQLDALTGNERVVLLSVGDNNAGFGEVTNNCLIHGGSGSNTCTQTYVSGGTNTLIARGRAISTEIGKALDAIRAKSKNAEIFLVGYMDIAPTNVAGCAGLMYLTQTDAPVFEQWEVAVNDTLREAAQAHDAHFVDAYSQSTAHTGCASPAAQRWTNPVNGVTSGVPLHPSAAGAQAVAGMVMSAMTTAGLYLGPEARVENLTFSKLRRAAKGATISRNPPVRGGAPVELELDEVAKVGLKLESVSPGRVVDGKCRTVNRKNKSSKRCTRYVARSGWWSAALPKGDTTVYVTGRAKGRKLSPGRYRLRLRSDSLHVATPATKSFAVTR